MCTDIFDGLFDFDMDGKTDFFELALGLNMLCEDEVRSENAMRFGSEDRGTGEMDDALASADMNRFDLALMDDAGRCEVLENAGLDPYDYV